MNVLIVSGIWPPDVGGPASHAPEVAEHLHRHGHRVRVLVTADVRPEQREYPVDFVSRALPAGVRHAALAGAIASRARDANVVYATSVPGRAAAGAALARTALVLKLTTDDAYERAVRLGLFAGDMDEFQRARGDARIAVLRAVRNASVRAAACVVCPSAYLRDLVVRWGVPRSRVTVIPNPAPAVRLVPSEEARRAFGVDGPTLAFAGRLGRQKALDVAFAALRAVDGVTLLVAGEGPERALLGRRAAELGVGDRVRFLGGLPRDEVLALFAAADASILPSTWENFPHTVVESLSVGTPVIATDVGGVAEAVKHEVNGLLVPAGDPEALGAAIARFYADGDLRARLREHAAPPVSLGAEAVYERLEDVLVRVARR